MLAPIEIRADFEVDAYEVMYRRLPEGAFVDHDVRVGPGVTASIMPDGHIMGIELLGLHSDTIAAAERYAAEHGLRFPAELPVPPKGGRRRRSR